MSPRTDGLAELLGLACRVAREAGALVHEGRAAGSPESDTKSSSTDVVTVFDTAAERLIVERLAAARPHDAIVGEEGAAHTGTSGVRWVVDPIDGTTNFLYGLPSYGISIAAEDGDSGLVGAVYVPTLGELFAARRAGGATLNDRPIHCSPLTDLRTALVGTGFSYDRAARARQGRRAGRLLPHVRDLRRLGAASVDLCFVACGRLDAYYEQYLNPWDLAAGALVAMEAGATSGTFPGMPGEPDGVVVAPPALYGPLRDLIGACADPENGTAPDS